MPDGPRYAPGRRRVPQQARSRELVDRLLTAAGVLFAERGYADTNTNLIAERAGVSVGSLYQFFASKDEILGSLQEVWTERLGAALDERLRADLDAGPVETIEHVLDIHAAFNSEPPGLLGFLLTAPVATSSAEHVLAAIRSRVEEKLQVLGVGEQHRAVAASMVVHISNGLYTVGRSEGATNAAVRSEVQRALVSYVRALSERSATG